MQDALDDLYQSGLVDGYRNKLEGAFSLGLGPSAEPPIWSDEQRTRTAANRHVHPRVALPAPNRVNFHAHAVANGSQTDGQVIARRLKASIRRGLKKYGNLLTRPYCPDIVVGKIQSAEHLERAVVYSEKVVALDLIYADALNRPEATNPDGTWSEDYAFGLGSARYMLVDESILAIFSGYRLDRDLHRLRRRKPNDNVIFNDRGKCKSRQFKDSHEAEYVFNLFRARAKARHIAFTLTLADFKVFCERTGYLQKRGTSPDAATIGRINHDEGYHSWNITLETHAQNSEQGHAIPDPETAQADRQKARFHVLVHAMKEAMRLRRAKARLEQLLYKQAQQKRNTAQTEHKLAQCHASLCRLQLRVQRP